MGSGLMQLVAMGAQDVFLTGNPQITFFKVVYKRHTNFSKECIVQEFNGSVPETGDTSSTVTCTLARNGDLVNEIILEADLTSSANTSVLAITSISNASLLQVAENQLTVSGFAPGDRVYVDKDIVGIKNGKKNTLKANTYYFLKTVSDAHGKVGLVDNHGTSIVIGDTGGANSVTGTNLIKGFLTFI